MHTNGRQAALSVLSAAQVNDSFTARREKMAEKITLVQSPQKPLLFYVFDVLAYRAWSLFKRATLFKAAGVLPVLFL
jgi:hypothetical protein